VPTVALFGGSFNPPHVAHQLVALYVLETVAVDELWFAPTARHPFAKQLVDFDHRVAMCELAAAAIGARARVTRIEDDVSRQPGFVSSRTLDTLHALVARHSGTRFRLVIGADILAETDKWHRWDEVARIAPPIVIGRGGVAPPPGAHVSELAMPEVSSTDVRARLARGEPVEALVPASVLGYLAEHGLYAGPTP
jgi:nicotinate-nucleotide adenylyltransferase